MLRLFKVTEHSLAPEYQEGDFVLTFKFPRLFHSLKAGDIIVFDHPSYGRMIKRVQTILPDISTLTVIGSHPDSIDSRKFGPIHFGTILGKVIWHIKRPPST